MKKLLEKIFSIKYIRKRIIFTFLGLTITYKKKKSNRRLIEELNTNVENLEFRLDLLMNYFFDIKASKKASGMLRQHQIDNIFILQQMKKICDENNLQYWVDFGTLLGATRHGGFIPWDDDLDVSMPEENYETFKQIAPNLLNPEIKVIECQEGFLRLEHVGYKQGCIDIFKYSDLGDKLQKTFLTEYFPNDYAIIPKEIIFPLSEIMFETILVKAPNDIDKYLRCRYGNYMLFPKAAHSCQHDCVPNERIVFYKEDECGISAKT